MKSVYRDNVLRDTHNIAASNTAKAIAAPLLIHLINRRPPQRKIFSHIPWLSAVHRETMPRKRLKDRLLLLARTLTGTYFLPMRGIVGPLVRPTRF